MRIFSEAEGKGWLSQSNIKTGERAWKESIAKNASFFLLPVDTGKKTALARFLSEFVGTSSETVFWITANGIFPSCENVN